MRDQGAQSQRARHVGAVADVGVAWLPQGENMGRRIVGFTSHELKDPHLTVIELTGQIESAEALDSVAEIVMSPEAGHVAILMEKVKYMNSKALGALIALHRKVEKQGPRMYTVNPIGGIKTVMERLGCYKLLRIRESLGEVVQEVKEIST